MPFRMAQTNTADSWLVYKIVDIVRHRSVQHRTVIATGILTNVLVIISVLSAFPWIRKSVSIRFSFIYLGNSLLKQLPSQCFRETPSFHWMARSCCMYLGELFSRLQLTIIRQHGAL